MNTIILFWNPGISSYTLERLREDLNGRMHVNNWSVWEHDKAHKGDRFFMVRCGKGQTGICMSGRFRSEPYRGEDWSGKGREVYYMDLRADTVIDPDLLPILSTEVLAKKIPSFDWSGGHSGRLLSGRKAKKLEKLWEEFLEENEEIFGRLALQAHISDADFEEEEENETCEAEIELSLVGGFEIFSPDGEVTVEGYNLNSLKEEFVQKMTEAGNTKPIEFHFEFIDDQNLFSKVLDIADDAYDGMTDEFGVPYLKRAIKEVKTLYTDASIIVGLLQYVFRNPRYTPKVLISKGISKVIVNTIVTLQKKEKENFEHYIERVGKTTAAASILYEILEDSLFIRELPELTMDKFTYLAQNLKAFHYLENKLTQNKQVTFNGPAKEFEMWCSLNDSASIFAIRGEYGDRSVALMSRVLSNLSKRNFWVDISELNVERWNRDEIFEITYEEEIFARVHDDTQICLLEKMIINRKYGTVFEVEYGEVFADDRKVLVHVPVDQQVEIPDSVEIIGRCAVMCNGMLENLEFPSKVRIIDDYAFAYCKKLRNVFMHDNIESIGEFCFDSCEIEKLRLSNSLTAIPDCAFLFNEIKHIDIPQNIRRIGSCAFEGNILDEELIIPEGVEIIESEAFCCTAIKKVSLPSTLTEIAYDFYFEEMIDGPEEDKPYVDIHPDNPVYYAKGGFLYSRATGKEVLGRAGRPEEER